VEGARRAWLTLAVVASVVAVIAIARWSAALVSGEPILYGEGAVAHAAILARDHLEYADVTIFAAANYPPLYFHIASLLDPFVAGRLASIGAAAFVTGAIFTRARSAGVVVAVALAASWLASAPVAVWGPAVKPDLVALAFTVAGVLALDRRRAALAGAALALAIWTKPTAALPALTLVMYLLVADRFLLPRFAVAAAAAGAIAAVLTHIPDGALFEHVVARNALDWSATQLILLLVLAFVVAGATFVAYALTRPNGPIAAYALGAVGIVVLGGREGATFNYLLDVITAATLGLAAVAPRLSVSGLFPVAAAAQLVIALAVLDPLGVLPGRAITTGAWAPSGRVAVVAGIPGELLVEDAGLLVANGREPAVDDLFLWSRLHDRGSPAAGSRLLDAVRSAEFAAVVSEVDLARIDLAPAFERERWHSDLVAAVLARYRLDRSVSGLFVYTLSR